MLYKAIFCGILDELMHVMGWRRNICAWGACPSLKPHNRRANRLQRHLVENPAAPLADPAVLFAVRIAGDSIKTIGIYPNDMAVVNKAHQLRNGNILLALLDTLFIMKRYCITQDGIRLGAANPNYPDMTITEANDFELWASSPIPFGRYWHDQCTLP